MHDETDFAYALMSFQKRKRADTSPFSGWRVHDAHAAQISGHAIGQMAPAMFSAGTDKFPAAVLVQRPHVVNSGGRYLSSDVSLNDFFTVFVHCFDLRN
jgi:hypothetical protein